MVFCSLMESFIITISVIYILKFSKINDYYGTVNSGGE